jgi:hypothetical protein
MLPGLSSKVPDFLWIAYNSVGIYPTFIEIERPGKVIFNADGSPSAKFTQASHQLVQWKAWLAKPGNDLVFKGEYGVSNAPSGSGQLDPRFILVYGRRAELHAKPDLARERALLFDNSTDFLTSYDRLVPDRMLANAITVKPLGSGRFRAIAVPPTFTLGPIDAERLVFVDGLDEAIACAEGISNERKAFLRERLPYWRQWAANEPRAWVTSTDVE